MERKKTKCGDFWVKKRILERFWRGNLKNSEDENIKRNFVKRNKIKQNENHENCMFNQEMF